MHHDDQSIRRREFLARSCVAGTICALGTSAAVDLQAAVNQTRRRKRPASIHDFDHEDWRELVGDKFAVKGSPHVDEQHEATLILRESSRRHHPSDKRRPVHLRAEGFSLLFAAADGEKVEHGTYTVTHPKLGKFLLFLHETKVDDGPRRRHYEAIFN